MAPQLTQEQKGMILGLRAGGFSVRQIAEKLDSSKSTVMRWLQRQKYEGTLRRKSGSGRPTALTDEEKINLMAAYCYNPALSMQELAEMAGLEISRQTAYRVLDEAGLLRRRQIRAGKSSSGAAPRMWLEDRRTSKTRLRAKSPAKQQQQRRLNLGLGGEPMAGTANIEATIEDFVASVLKGQQMASGSSKGKSNKGKKARCTADETNSKNAIELVPLAENTLNIQQEVPDHFLCLSTNACPEVPSRKSSSGQRNSGGKQSRAKANAVGGRAKGVKKQKVSHLIFDA